MKRRNFLKRGFALALASSLLMTKILQMLPNRLIDFQNCVT